MSVDINADEKKKQAAGNYGKIFQTMIDNYSKCSVTWEQPSSPLVTDLERDTDGYGDQTDDLSSTKSDGSYNTNENPDMSVDINADENERQVADPGYVDPNEKLVDPAPAAPVTCGAPVQVDASYTGDSADLTKGTEETKDEIADIANPY